MTFLDEVVNDRDQLRWILYSLNTISLIFAVSTSIGFFKGFKKYNLQSVADSRRFIQLFFYEITFIPVLVGIVGHYGAEFETQAIWIFPVMYIILAINYVVFISVLFRAAGKRDKVIHHLQLNPDRCRFKCCETRVCCCLMQSDAWKGAKLRIFLCYLIFFKPVCAYIVSVLIFFEGDQSLGRKVTRDVVNLFGFVFTIIPLQALKSFEVNLKQLSRMTHTTSKVNLIRLLVSVTAVQDTVMKFLVGMEAIRGAEGITPMNRAVRIEGMLLCVEMVLISAANHFIYRAEDLTHWEFRPTSAHVTESSHFTQKYKKLGGKLHKMHKMHKMHKYSKSSKSSMRDMMLSVGDDEADAEADAGLENNELDSIGDAGLGAVSAGDSSRNESLDTADLADLADLSDVTDVPGSLASGPDDGDYTHLVEMPAWTGKMELGSEDVSAGSAGSARSGGSAQSAESTESAGNVANTVNAENYANGGKGKHAAHRGKNMGVAGAVASAYFAQIAGGSDGRDGKSVQHLDRRTRKVDADASALLKTDGSDLR